MWRHTAVDCHSYFNRLALLLRNQLLLLPMWWIWYSPESFLWKGELEKQIKTSYKRQERLVTSAEVLPLNYYEGSPVLKSCFGRKLFLRRVLYSSWAVSFVCRLLWPLLCWNWAVPLFTQQVSFLCYHVYKENKNGPQNTECLHGWAEFSPHTFPTQQPSCLVFNNNLCCLYQYRFLVFIQWF